MLPSHHSHAWDIDKADTHLAPQFRKRYLTNGANVVITPQMRQLAGGMTDALDNCTATAISGPYGSGKSTTLAALAAVADVNVAIVDLNKAGSDRAQWAQITHAITGLAHVGAAETLQQVALEYLNLVPTVLIVDEAQHLRRSALQQLRWLWETRCVSSLSSWQVRTCSNASSPSSRSTAASGVG